MARVLEIYSGANVAATSLDNAEVLLGAVVFAGRSIFGVFLQNQYILADFQKERNMRDTHHLSCIRPDLPCP